MWITLPGGGVYLWAWIPAACFVLILAIRLHPAIASTPDRRAIDLALIALIAAIAVQLLPMPYGILKAIDPNALLLREELSASSAASPVPISVVPHSSLEALGIVASAVLLFWTTREICEAGGAGRIIRVLGIFGLLLSLIGIVQHSPNQTLLYGYWAPQDAGARPFGPFVNRNHFATWLIIACPLVFGYVLARAPIVGDRQRFAQRVAATAAQLGSIRIWLIAAVCLMALAVMLSTSRSGLIGLMAAMAVSIWLSRRHGARQTRGWLVFQLAVLVVVVLSSANFGALSSRIDETIADAESGSGRTALWRDATHVVQDFTWTGTGAGTYGAAIVPYQTAARGYAIGQAHNQYLQIVAEGGALVAIPALAVGVVFALMFWSRLAESDRPDSLIRAGAIAGIVGVLVQSIWETGLRMPANAMLFAVAAAIAIHAPSTQPVVARRTN